MNTNLRENGSIGYVLAYLDDVVIARPPNDVLEGFNTLKEASKGTGLNINLRKCSLFTSSDEQPLDALPQDIEVQKEGIRLLGSPIGTKDEFEDDWCKAFAEDCARDLAAIEEYGKDEPPSRFPLSTALLRSEGQPPTQDCRSRQRASCSSQT